MHEKYSGLLPNLILNKKDHLMRICPEQKGKQFLQLHLRQLLQKTKKQFQPLAHCLGSTAVRDTTDLYSSISTNAS